jgi:hypothetical protein
MFFIHSENFPSQINSRKVRMGQNDINRKHTFRLFSICCFLILLTTLRNFSLLEVILCLLSLCILTGETLLKVGFSLTL